MPLKYQNRIIVGALAGLSLLTVLVGFAQVRAHLVGPFGRSSPSTVATRNVPSATGSTSLEALKGKDTDQDGLSDYDELYTYKTSPYLKDSDSDGQSDKAELDKGDDPNCPQGKDCAARRVADSTEQIANSNVPRATSNVPLLNPELGQGASLEDLRAALRAAGVSEEQLAKLDDAQLQDLYNQVRQEEVSGTGLPAGKAGQIANSNVPLAVSNTPSATSLQSLSPAEIRSLMIASGIPKETLDQVDDATLQQLFLQALEQQQGQ